MFKYAYGIYVFHELNFMTNVAERKATVIKTLAIKLDTFKITTYYLKDMYVQRVTVDNILKWVDMNFDINDNSLIFTKTELYVIAMFASEIARFLNKKIL